MKRILLILLCALSLALPAMAADADPPAVEESTSPVTVETTEGEKDIVVNVTVNNPAVDPASDTSEEVPVLAPTEDAVPPASVSPSGVVRDSATEGTSDTKTPLQAAITSLFGEYHPKTYTVTTYLEDGSVVTSQEYVPGLAGLDWLWIASAALFALSLFCVFRMVGGIFKWK